MTELILNNMEFTLFQCLAEVFQRVGISFS
jgi:hypothetical protein